MRDWPRTFWGCLTFALCGLILAAFCCHFAMAQTITMMPTPSNCLFGVSASWTGTVQFCWLCSTSTPNGPWWPCSGTQTIYSGQSVTNILTLGTNVARGFVKEERIQ
jgi:hypothetical protein